MFQIIWKDITRGRHLSNGQQVLSRQELIALRLDRGRIGTLFGMLVLRSGLSTFRVFDRLLRLVNRHYSTVYPRLEITPVMLKELDGMIGCP